MDSPNLLRLSSNSQSERENVTIQRARHRRSPRFASYTSSSPLPEAGPSTRSDFPVRKTSPKHIMERDRDLDNALSSTWHTPDAQASRKTQPPSDRPPTFSFSFALSSFIISFFNSNYLFIVTTVSTVFSIPLFLLSYVRNALRPLLYWILPTLSQVKSRKPSPTPPYSNSDTSMHVKEADMIEESSHGEGPRPVETKAIRTSLFSRVSIGLSLSNMRQAIKRFISSLLSLVAKTTPSPSAIPVTPVADSSMVSSTLPPAPMPVLGRGRAQQLDMFDLLPSSVMERGDRGLVKVDIRMELSLGAMQNLRPTLKYLKAENGDEMLDLFLDDPSVNVKSAAFITLTHQLSWEGNAQDLPAVMKDALPCSITDLSITNCSLSTSDIITILETWPTLKSLDVDQVEDIPPVLLQVVEEYSRSHGLVSLSLTSKVPLDPIMATSSFINLSSISLRLLDSANLTSFHCPARLFGPSLKGLRVTADLPSQTVDDIRTYCAESGGIDLDIRGLP